MATQNTTSDRSTHQWSDAELKLLVENTSLPRTEMVEKFRAAFPDFDGSDQAIIGRRYAVTRRPSKSNPGLIQTATENRIADLEAELEEERAKLDAITNGTFFAQDDDPEIDLDSMTKAELQSVARKRNVEFAKSWTKGQLVEAINA